MMTPTRTTASTTIFSSLLLFLLTFRSSSATTNKDVPLLTAGALPLPSLIPIGSPGGLDPKMVELIGNPSNGDAALAPALSYVNKNEASKTAPLLGSDPATSEPPPLTTQSLVELQTSQPSLYVLPTGEELNRLNEETKELQLKNDQNEEMGEMEEHKKEEQKKEQAEEKEENKEEEEEKKVDPLERDAPIHGLRKFGWKPQIDNVGMTDPLLLNSNAFETLLLEKVTRATRTTRTTRTTSGRTMRKRLRQEPGVYKGPAKDDAWNTMQASTPFDDKDAGYVMPAMKPDGEIDIPTDLNGGEAKGGSGGSSDVDGIEAEADKMEQGAAAQVVGDIENGMKVDFKGLPG